MGRSLVQRVPLDFVCLCVSLFMQFLGFISFVNNTQLTLKTNGIHLYSRSL